MRLVRNLLGEAESEMGGSMLLPDKPVVRKFFRRELDELAEHREVFGVGSGGVRRVHQDARFGRVPVF